MSLQLIATTAEQLPLIRNLYQFYAYESSDWEQEDVEVDGRFYVHDPYLELYWQRPQWSAQLIVLDGFIAGFLLIERSEIAGVDALEFADLFLLKKYRRQGIGRALVEHSLDRARSEGFLAMQFNYVVSSNAPAVELYRKLGFAVVGTLPAAFRHRTLGLVDVYVMHRFL